MLVFEVEPVVKQASVGEVDRPGGIVKAIGDIKVQIFREKGGIGILSSNSSDLPGSNG